MTLLFLFFVIYILFLPFNIDGHGYLSFLWIQASLNCGHFFASLLQKHSLLVYRSKNVNDKNEHI